MMDPVISLDAHHVRLSLINASNAARRRYLRHFHRSRDKVRCLCQGAPGISMGVALRQRPTETYYLYHLHDNDGLRHSPHCPNYHVPQTTPEAGASPTRAVVQRGAEFTNFNLIDPTYQAPPSSGAAANRNIADTNRRRPSNRGRLLTLLEALWIDAGLCQWNPGFEGKRHYGLVQHFVSKVAARYSVQRIPLKSRFLMPPPYTAQRKEQCNAALARFLDAIAPRSGHAKTLHGYVVGLLSDVDTNEGWLRLAHLAPRLTGQASVIASAVNRWGLVARQSIVLACVEAGTHAQHRSVLRVISLAALQLSSTLSWIPVDSSHERALCDHLIAQKRAFDKPLGTTNLLGRSTLPANLLPDFVLTDMHPPIYMEVLGMMDNEEYAAHAEQKRQAYRDLRSATWWWDTRNPQPPLPTP